MAKHARAMSRTLHRSTRIELPSEGPLRVVIVSDTHSEPHAASYGLVARERPHAILHAGDIGALEVLDPLREIAPLIAVRGNIDTRAAAIPDSVDITFCESSQPRMTMLLIHMAVYGPRLLADVARTAEAHGAQLVVCGHSHVPFLGRDRGITLFNPGSIGPPRPPLPITFGVLEMTASSASLRHVSCETGERWLP